ncbi:MAG: ABC transporter permease [Clostridiaceae bacterium]
MKIRRISAVFTKQIKDTLKNKTVLANFILLPLMTLVLTQAMGKNLSEMPDNYFVIMFSAMYVGMIPLMNSAAIIGEEKEKNTLRTLIMANVKPMEYLIGIALFIVFASSLGALAMALIGGISGMKLIMYMGVMILGSFASYFIGCGIGIMSQNQMSATSIATPFMLLFSFLPMLSMFNKTIESIAKFSFTQQIYSLLQDLTPSNFTPDKFAIIFINIIIFIIFFVYAYRKSRLAD